MTKIKTARALREKIDGYFRRCDEAGALYGEAGLALYLDVPLETLRAWYDDGADKPAFREAVREAYLRIQAQIESDCRYHERSMVTRGTFLLKQPRLGGYQDRGEVRQDGGVRLILGRGMEESDFQ